MVKCPPCSCRAHVKHSGVNLTIGQATVASKLCHPLCKGSEEKKQMTSRAHGKEKVKCKIKYWHDRKRPQTLKKA